MEKDILECQEFYGFLLNCTNRLRGRDDSESEEEAPTTLSNDIFMNKPIKDKKKKRHRRKASQIERMFKCQEKHCNRSYGTEGALKMHIKIKHPYVHYDTKYSKGKLIKKDKDNINHDISNIKNDKEDNDLVESSLLLSNLSHTIESHQPLIATPSPISYNYMPRIETQHYPQSLTYDDKTNNIQPKPVNIMSLNNLINSQ